MRTCNEINPDTKEGCRLKYGHLGAHMHNGLQWEPEKFKDSPPPSPLQAPPDPINPAHYTKHPSGIECIEIARHMNFNRGNAMKYIWRAGEKGNEVEDLKKAIWYLNDEIKRISK